MIRFLTSGESHGQALISILEGIPSNLNIDIDFINNELSRRQVGYGRGARMKIEKDRVNILSGVRFGKTTGAPIAIEIKNKDWENWQEKMSVIGSPPEGFKEFTRPRPGHADLVGALKYNQRDIRNVLERSSARETASRVAVGAFCKLLLKEFDIKVISYVTQIGSLSFDIEEKDYLKRFEKAESSSVRFPDPSKDKFFEEYIEKMREEGETLGGIFEVIALNVPPGLGSYIQWDKRIDGKIAMAMMSIQAIKAVEIGDGFEGCKRKGSEVMDEIGYKDESFFRYTNHLGGTEGGMTNGNPIVVRVGMKPIPTLMKPLSSVDINTKEETKAAKERSDVTAISAAAVVGEAMLSIVLADTLLEKLGGDNMEEIRERFYMMKKHYKEF